MAWESLALPADFPATGPRLPCVSRAADFIELLKPKIALTVGFTVAAGYLAAVATTSATFQWKDLIFGVIGVTLVAFGSAVFNQAWEHRTDGEMARTAGRPIPTGRVSQAEAMLVGMLVAPLGLAILAPICGVLCAVLTGLTCGLYAFCYTPLKRVSAWSTFVGAIPGAMPPVLGASVVDRLPAAGWTLFVVLFLWQFPHFIAIAWKYREQYAGAGLHMLPAGDEDGRKAGVLASVTGGLLVFACVPLWLLGLPVSAAAAAIAGIAYAAAAVVFNVDRSRRNSGRMLGLSFLYVPVVFGAVIAESVWRLV